MLRIRLARRGRKKRPSYRIVVIPSRSARDGRHVDDLGYYDPLSDPSVIQIDVEKARKWVRHGAQPSDRVWKLLEVAEPGFRDGLKQVEAGTGAAASTEAAPASEANGGATAKAQPKAKAKSTAKAKSKGKSKAKAKSKSTAKSGGKAKAK